MKKIIAVAVLVIVILGIMFAVAKFTSPDEEETTVQTSESTTEESTIPVMATTETEAQTEPSATAMSTTVPSTKVTTTSPSTTSTTAPTTQPTTQPTTAPTTQPTTQPTTESATNKQNGTSELLNKYVLAPINSGNFTMTISAFGEDKSPDDKLIKTVSGGKTAFWFSIPAANMSFKVFPSDGKYYLATESKYCELTKAQYDSCCATFNRGMYNFGGLSYQQTETVRDGFSLYTCEQFKTADGKDCILWFNGNQLTKLELKIDGVSQSLPMTVSSSVNSNYFSLGADLEQVDYETLKSYIDLAGLFF